MAMVLLGGEMVGLVACGWCTLSEDLDLELLDLELLELCLSRLLYIFMIFSW